MNTTQQDSIIDNFNDKFIQLVSSKLVKKLMNLLVMAIDDSIEFNQDASSHMSEINRMRDDFKEIQKIAETNI